MKKRNCRFTPEEKENHTVAVWVRKKTDKELVEYLEQEKTESFKNGVETFLHDIDGVRGIGLVTRKKLHNLAEERGYLGI
jgi:CHAD domain-containing protein